MITDLDTARALARRAVLRGGNVVREAAADRSPREKSLPGDYVTEVDLASERAIAEVLRSEAPEPILAEEGGASGELGSSYWVVDPLDGTTNFVHGFPAVGVSVALVRNGGPVAGAIRAPFLGMTWTAAAGRGASSEVDGGEATACTVAARPVDRAVVGTGFPFRRKDRLERYLSTLEPVLELVEDLRRPGAAALDLAWVADGTFDGFFELGLAPWDVAAGGLLVQEAGGVVTDWSGEAGWLGGDVVAAPPQVHPALVELTRRATP